MGSEMCIRDRARHEHTVQVAALLLPVAPHARGRLLVVCRVPVGVEEHEAVAADEVKSAACDDTRVSIRQEPLGSARGGMGEQRGHQRGTQLRSRGRVRSREVARARAPPAFEDRRKQKRPPFGSLNSVTMFVRFLMLHEPSSLQHFHPSSSHMRSNKSSVCV